MTLVASCGGLYFPDPPMDNVLTLTWQYNKDDKQNIKPFSSVIFKVKSSAPHLFYVLPRYGALLLPENNDSNKKNSNNELYSTQITFGLRPPVGDGAGNNTPNTTTTSRRSLPSSSGGHNNNSNNNSSSSSNRNNNDNNNNNNPHQERFAIEYALITSDQSVYNRLAQALASDGRLTEAVRGVWEAVVAGNISAVRGIPINLKAYTNGVVMNNNNNNNNNNNIAGVSSSFSSLVVVPPSARLVRPSLRERVASRTSRASTQEGSVSPPSRKSHNYNFNNNNNNNNWGKGAGAGELRSLRLGIDALRHEAPTTAAEVGRSHTSTTNNTNTNNNSITNNSEKGNSKLTMPSTDMIMRLPQLEKGVSSGGGKHGLPLFIVLAAMFTTYIISILLFRTRGGGGGEITSSSTMSIDAITNSEL